MATKQVNIRIDSNDIDDIKQRTNNVSGYCKNAVFRQNLIDKIIDYILNNEWISNVYDNAYLKEIDMTFLKLKRHLEINRNLFTFRINNDNSLTFTFTYNNKILVFDVIKIKDKENNKYTVEYIESYALEVPE